MRLDISSGERVELIDITDSVKHAVKQAGIHDGICTISTLHTTTAIIINENEQGLRTDIINMLNALVPPSAGYHHDVIDNNADAHLKAVLLGPSRTIPIESGRPVLGTWQRIFLVELDGPRQRTVNVTVINKQ